MPSIMQPSTTLDTPAPRATDPFLPWESRFARMGFKRYCAFAALIALAGSAALMGTATFLNGLFHVIAPFHAPSGHPGVGQAFVNIVLEPFVDALLLIGLLKLLRRWGLSEAAAVIVSAVVWGILNGMQHPLRFFGIAWSFAVFGYSYFLWHRRQPSRGFAAASLTCALVNALAIAVLFFDL
jgi:hypothetical protein